MLGLFFAPTTQAWILSKLTVPSMRQLRAQEGSKLSQLMVKASASWAVSAWKGVGAGTLERRDQIECKKCRVTEGEAAKEEVEISAEPEGKE